MVKNGYHDIANQIIKEDELERQINEARRAGSEMHEDRLRAQKAERDSGGTLYTLPAIEMAQLLGWVNISEEEIQALDALSPEQKEQVVRDLANSDGLGSIMNTIDYVLGNQTQNDDQETEMRNMEQGN
jgi:hypothetical protein